MSVPESTSRPTPSKPAAAAGLRDACRSRHPADILAQPAIPGRKACQPAEAESLAPTGRVWAGSTPRSWAIPTSDGPRRIFSSWDPLPLGQPALDQLSLRQLFSTQLQRPRATPIVMVLSTRLQALAASFAILLVPGQMASLQCMLTILWLRSSMVPGNLRLHVIKGDVLWERSCWRAYSGAWPSSSGHTWRMTYCRWARRA